MDSLTSTVSVSILKVPPHKFTNRELYRFKASPTRSQQQQHVFSASASAPKTNTFSHKSSPSLQFSPSALKPIFHRNPATGYAAALVDVAHKTNSLHSVHADVERLLKLLQSLNFPSPVFEQGNFHRHLVALLKMLVKKNKVFIVKEVLHEFQRIYDELCGTQIVLLRVKEPKAVNSPTRHCF